MSLTPGAPLRVGWNRVADHPYDYRWWTGAAWSDAYWPAESPRTAYFPEAQRWNVSSGGEPSFDVVGENWHEDEIARAIRGWPQLNEERIEYAEAELVCEPDNPHDANAISVRVAGGVLGYLPRELAGEYCRTLHRLARGGVVATVACRIWAVSRSDGTGGTRLKAAVRVALPPAEHILPTNAFPPGPLAIIPRGRRIQVSGEEKHLDSLSAIGSSANVMSTLHPIEITTARSSRRQIEVRVDGQRVGQLTPATSAALLPLVDRAAARGRSTGAWARVTASRFAAEVVLDVARPEVISAAWPDTIDLLPVLKTDGPVPDAYIDSAPLTPPPSPRGFGAAGWTAVIIVLALLASIPYAGALLAVCGLVAALVWRRRLVRRPPSSARPVPTSAPAAVLSAASVRGRHL